MSLRDVERAMIVFKYFFDKMNIFAPLIDQKQQQEEKEKHHEVIRPKSQDIGNITRAVILSLSVCYHARLRKRDAYEVGVSKQFVNPLSLPGGDNRFRDEIRWLVLAMKFVHWETFHMK